MRRGSSFLPFALVGGLVLMLFAGIGLRWLVATRTAAERARSPRVATAPTAPLARRDTSVPNADAPGNDVAQLDPLATLEDSAGAWASVDLEAIRAALPDNQYWKMGAPTKDPEVRRAREEDRERWNVEYGKVLSNTATDEEIDSYYARRQRLHEDYLEFIVYLMTNYGYQIPPRDVALLKLAGEMQHARLEEIPRQIAEAHQRHAAHEAARQAWLEEQKAFGDDADRQGDGDQP